MILRIDGDILAVHPTGGILTIAPCTSAHENLERSHPMKYHYSQLGKFAPLDFVDFQGNIKIYGTKTFNTMAASSNEFLLDIIDDNKKPMIAKATAATILAIRNSGINLSQLN